MQKACFVCSKPISTKIKSATCKDTKCQYNYDIQEDTWKKTREVVNFIQREEEE